MLKIIVLAGGAGNRLWPLSKRYCSNSYLSILEGPDGVAESMVQRVRRQLESADLIKDSRFVTCRQQAELLREHIGGQSSQLVMPEQKGSFTAAALAAAYLYSVTGASLNETVIVMPSDTYVEMDYFQYIRSLPKLLVDSGSELMMIGVKPHTPDEQYDYIIPEKSWDDDEADFFDSRVQSYRYKPSVAESEKLLKRNALWNSRTYAFKLDWMIAKLMDDGYPVQYDELYELYDELPKVSFEAEIINRSAVSKSVVVYEGSWRDMSSWKSLSENIRFPRQLIGFPVVG